MASLEFQVELPVFRGPLDLLWYLVRKEELDVTAVSLGRIAQQFVEHLETLQALEVDAIGEFVEVASLLIEWKSRRALPRDDGEQIAPEDPADDLVERLLEYKRFRDAASRLDDRCRQWQHRRPRMSVDLTRADLDHADEPIRDIEIWDLIGAFGRVLRERETPHVENIVYDDTPLTVYMTRIKRQLVDAHEARLSDLVSPGMHKSAIVGVFLAVLELARHHSVTTEQSSLHGEIVIRPGEDFSDAPVEDAEPSFS